MVRKNVPSFKSGLKAQCLRGLNVSGSGESMKGTVNIEEDWFLHVLDTDKWASTYILIIPRADFSTFF